MFLIKILASLFFIKPDYDIKENRNISIKEKVLKRYWI